MTSAKCPCAAYIASQKHEGWVLLHDRYDDGGISGGALERAALQRLLTDVDEGLFDQIVVYKTDRLTRSLADFAKLVDRLDAIDASFVSVTQSFNTATSMGRLTPTHANKKGQRYRYYVSNRMISRPGDSAGQNATDGWRLPAQSLEQQIATSIEKHLRQRLPRDLLMTPSVVDIQRAKNRLDELASGQSQHLSLNLLPFLNRAIIAPGRVDIVLNQKSLAEQLGFPSASLNPDALIFSLPFQHRKRGVETKLIIGADQGQHVDETLIRNIAKAHQYYNAIMAGQSFEEIAAPEGTSKRRALQIIDLAFLAPDIVKMILQGEQPFALTSKWLAKNPLPSDWECQRQIVTSL